MQPQKIARDLKFRNKEEEGLYNPCGENKGTDEFHDYLEADLRLCYKMDKTSIFMFEILEPGGQLWANTAFEGSQFYSIGVPKFYSWVNVISVYAYNDLG